MNNANLKILLLCNYQPNNAATVCDHINAFHQYSRHDVTIFSYLVSYNGQLPEDVSLDRFDVVVLHYSIFLAIDAYASPKTRQKLKAFSGVKAIFLQDEYRFVKDSVRRIHDIGFDIIFTCVPENAIDHVYPASDLPGVKRVNVLTGYVSSPLHLYEPIPLNKRRYDVSYRGRKYPAWHGRMGLEKWKIAERFSQDARSHRLKTNISFKEEDRLYGDRWVTLIRQSRAVLGVESGASVFDFSGCVSAKTDTIATLIPDSPYDTLRNKYFGDLEDVIPLAQISPRIFEAITLRTSCILYEGEYSGVIKPWRHYIPLQKDHGNMVDVVNALRDHERLAEIIATAYCEVALNRQYSYETFIGTFDSHIEEICATRKTRGVVRQRQCEKIAPTSDDVEPPAIEKIREKYPFIFVPNPHSLVFSQPKLLYKGFQKIRPFIPQSVIRVVKVLVSK